MPTLDARAHRSPHFPHAREEISVLSSLSRCGLSDYQGVIASRAAIACAVLAGAQWPSDHQRGIDLRAAIACAVSVMSPVVSRIDSRSMPGATSVCAITSPVCGYRQFRGRCHPPGAERTESDRTVEFSRP
eukprot:2697456-Pyramimonas_sp.AAC.3